MSRHTVAVNIWSLASAAFVIQKNETKKIKKIIFYFFISSQKGNSGPAMIHSEIDHRHPKYLCFYDIFDVFYDIYDTYDNYDIYDVLYDVYDVQLFILIQ